MNISDTIREDHGFITCTVPPTMIEQAKLIRSRRDKLYGNYFAEKNTDARWVGDLAEIVFYCWARPIFGSNITWHVHDDVRKQPDFTINGITIDIKAVKRQVGMQPNYGAQITKRQAGQSVDHYFFMSYELPVNRMWFCGGLPKDEYLKRADYHGPGTTMHANYQVRGDTDIYDLYVKYLKPTMEWLNHFSPPQPMMSDKVLDASLVF